MSGSSIGNIFRVTTWGESHGAGIGVVIDGCPAGLDLSESDIQPFLNRRKPGTSEVTTPRKEDDLIEILSGKDNGLKSQLKKQLLKGVFEEINFRKLHNNCRYPQYNNNSENYYVLNISEKDCIRIKEIATKLDLFLDDFYKIQ